MRFARVTSTFRASFIAAIFLWVAAITAFIPIAMGAPGVVDSPRQIGALSRKIHGAAGTFDLTLSIIPTNPTTEPRSGPAHTIVFWFDKDVSTINTGIATVTEGVATVGTPTFVADKMIVPLTGVANQQYVTVVVTNVVATDGGTGGYGSVRVGFLQGDVSNNRVVTVADLGQVNAQIAQLVDDVNFLKDVNASGTLSVADKGITNAQVTKALTAVPPPANTPPFVNAGADASVELAQGANLTGVASDDGLPGPLTVTWSKVSGPGTVTFGNANASTTTASFSVVGDYVLRLTANDGALSNADDVAISVTADGTGFPPDPAAIAPTLDRSVATHIGTSTAFLYTGANPIQTGVASGSIDVKRAAVLRGRVVDRSGAAVGGAAISINAHPEFGQTLSRADGRFDLAVNGGGILTMNYKKSGLLAVQRQVEAPWQDFVVVEDVVMIAADVPVTAIASGAQAMQVARGSTQTDTSGTRRATVLFPSGTMAALVQPDGSTVPTSTLNVRLTEYTVGANGPQAMPAPLSPASGYTYAVELGADEAIAKVNGRDVVFNQPVVFYVENFLGFPIGIPVPQGFYDRDKAAWVGSDSGRVIKIIGVTGGFADVDSVGTGGMTPLVLSQEERQQLAALYPVGQELWRVTMPHFSTWDSNWPVILPSDATDPNQPEPEQDQTVDQCIDEAMGSIIECQNQVLGESVRIVGTPFTLNYRSLRAPGYVAGNTLRIPLSGASVPASLKRIDVEVQIGGRAFPQSFSPGPNKATNFVWDGIDVYGRAVQGRQPATVSVGYVYEALYVAPGQSTTGAFGRPGADTQGLVTVRRDVTRYQKTSKTAGTLDARPGGLGGWTLSANHLYDTVGKVAQLGDGNRQSAEAAKSIIQTVAGTGFDPGTDADGIPATQARLAPTGIAVGADGTVFISDTKGRVRRIGADGIITTMAGGGAPGNVGDGGLATNAELVAPQGLAVGPDGSLYIAETNGHRIRRVAPNGIITTVAGNGVASSSGDGGLATLASVSFPQAIAVAPDGGLYFTEDFHTKKIRYIAPDGIITKFAGGASGPPIGDGGLATQAFIDSPRGIALGPDGAVYVADDSLDRVRRIGLDGVITTVAMVPGNPWGVAVGRTGALYVSNESSFNSRVVQVIEGSLVPIAGNGQSDDYVGENVPATQAIINFPHHLAIGPDGTLFLHENDSPSARVYRIVPPVPSFTGAQSVVASPDGRVVYAFDAVGRHLLTADALTGGVLHEFTYDGAGRLTSIVEKTGGTDNVTTIQHDGNGNPTKIVGPYGQETLLTVDGDGFLASITNPANESTQLTYFPGGLLQSYTDPRGKTSQYTFDGDGRLTHAADPAGGSLTLVRTMLPGGSSYSVAKTTSLGHTTLYTISQPASGDRTLTTLMPGGESTTLLTKSDGTRIYTLADGTVKTTVLGPDPRFGMQVPVATSAKVRTPAGLQRTSNNEVAAILSDPNNPLSLVSLSRESSTSIGAISTTYTAATRTLVATTAVGRTTTVTLDALGRILTSQIGGLETTTTAYDSRGRPASLSIGSGASARTFNYTYNAQGYLQTVTDPLGRVAQFVYDAAGRVTNKTLPGTQAINTTYDAAGNLATLTPPGRPAHSFAYSDRNELTVETPPVVTTPTPMATSYDVDRMLSSVLYADARGVVIGFDAAGRPLTRALSTNGGVTGTDTLTYDSLGRITNVAAANGMGNSYTYDGVLALTETATGAFAGSVARTYDSSFRLASQSVNGSNTVAFGYDNDERVTAAGNLTITRNAQTGLPTGTTLGVVTTGVGYNTFGELTNYSASVSGSSIYNLGITRDLLGRISTRTETIGGVTDSYGYSYDANGHLAQVTKNGLAVESYGYDANGNRTSATVLGAAVTANYDVQDRLSQYGSAVYAHSPSGQLLSKTSGGQTTGYQYDQLGNLLGVTLPSGTVVGYIVDGRGRRVAKKINGTTVKGFLYNDARRPVAELDSLGDVVNRFVYAGGNTPTHMIRAGVNFRIISDQLGSVRLVVNSATGAIFQRLDYDTFGNVLQDTNPGFQPFGYAGGIYDEDTGLVRFGARDYDASTGRWTTKDPADFGGGDVNLYRYVHGDPVNSRDPRGESEFYKQMAYLREAIASAERAIEETAQDMEGRMARGRLRDFRDWAKKELESMRKMSEHKANKLNAGGVLGYCLLALQALDLYQMYEEADENGRTLFEQEEFEEQQAMARGVHTFISCLGPICLVDERM